MVKNAKTSKFVHDDFCKSYLDGLLSPLGTVKVNFPFPAQTRAADVWFVPGDLPAEDQRLALGLLGRLTLQPCLLEPFRNPVPISEIRNCLSKLFQRISAEERAAKRKKRSIPEDGLPRLWILTPTASQRIRDSFGAVETELGIYLLPDANRTGLVVLNHLPKTRDTLWLRVLSRGRVQKNALKELAALPVNDPLRRDVGELLANYRTVLENRKKRTEEEEELLMNLAPEYLQKQQDWKQEGLLEGLQQERQTIALNCLQEGMAIDLIVRLTGLSPEAIQKLSQTLQEN
jgi:hypothetical protein